jgi:lysophospholipase L1-like esterase
MNKNKSSTMYVFWSVAIIGCLALVLFALLFSSCSKGGETPSAQESAAVTDPAGTQNPDATQDPNATQSPQDTSAPQSPAASGAELGETADAGAAYQDKLTFLGDSTTYGLKYYGVLSAGKNTTQVWTPSSGTLALFNQSIATIVYPETGEEITIVDAATRKQPEYLVITLGVNGVASMDETAFKSDYTKLVQSVLAASPETKIICNSIYPVTPTYEAKGLGIDNAKIVTANGWIRQVAEECGVKYCNSASAIANESGAMPDELCNDVKEGLHMNEAGYAKVLTYLRTHAYQ